MQSAPHDITKAVILARGLGKRMRSSNAMTAETAKLAPEQSRAADAGMKAMIPLSIGRPFLDFVLSALADAGFREICLVIGPEHNAVREYYGSIPLRRIRVSFAIQEQPIGTANAVLTVDPFADGESFLVMNSDNYYPVEAIVALRSLGEPGLPAFEREALVRDGNIPAERLRGYALLEIDANGYLEEIVEKPNDINAGAMSGATAIGGPSEEQFISMNCWRFDSAIFRACREVPRSKRGEFELPEAVQYGMKALGMRFKALPVHSGVLDLSYRGDIAEVARRLSDVRVEL